MLVSDGVNLILGLFGNAFNTLVAGVSNSVGIEEQEPDVNQSIEEVQILEIRSSRYSFVCPFFDHSLFANYEV